MDIGNPTTYKCFRIPRRDWGLPYNGSRPFPTLILLSIRVRCCPPKHFLIFSSESSVVLILKLKEKYIKVFYISFTWSLQRKNMKEYKHLRIRLSSWKKLRRAYPGRKDENFSDYIERIAHYKDRRRPKEKLK